MFSIKVHKKESSTPKKHQEKQLSSGIIDTLSFDGKYKPTTLYWAQNLTGEPSQVQMDASAWVRAEILLLGLVFATPG